MPEVLERLTSALSDGYAIQRELGRGGAAIVFLADDLRHERQVAIKVLRPELTSQVASEHSGPALDFDSDGEFEILVGGAASGFAPTSRIDGP